MFSEINKFMHIHSYFLNAVLAVIKSMTIDYFYFLKNELEFIKLEHSEEQLK